MKVILLSFVHWHLFTCINKKWDMSLMLLQARKDKLSFNDEYSFIEWVINTCMCNVG